MCRASCKALSHPHLLVLGLHKGIMWVQGYKGDCSHFIEKEIESHPERRTPLPKVMWLLRISGAPLSSLPSSRLPPSRAKVAPVLGTRGQVSSWQTPPGALQCPLAGRGGWCPAWTQDLPIKHRPATKTCPVPTPRSPTQAPWKR